MTRSLCRGLPSLFCWLLAGARHYAARDQIATFRAGVQVSSIIEQATAPSDTVLLWGAETRINFFSQRASPSRFSYQFPLYHPAYTNEGLIIEFLDAILEERPRMIIDTGNPATPIFDFPITTSAIQERIEAIQANYRVTGDLAGETLYEPAVSHRPLNCRPLTAPPDHPDAPPPGCSRSPGWRRSPRSGGL